MRSLASALAAFSAPILVGCGTLEHVTSSAVDAASRRLEEAIPRLVDAAAARAESAVERLPELAETIARDVAERVAPAGADGETLGAYETAIGALAIAVLGGAAQWVRNRWSNEKKAGQERSLEETRKRVEALADATARLEGRTKGGASAEAAS